MSATRCSSDRRPVVPLMALCLLALVLALMAPTALLAQTPAPASAATAPHAGGGEASLRMPDVGAVQLMGINGRTLLLGGLVVCVLGLVFGLVIYKRIEKLPVHASMREISELIYETCKTYLIQQGKFLLILEVFIGVIIATLAASMCRRKPK